MNSCRKIISIQGKKFYNKKYLRICLIQVILWELEQFQLQELILMAYFNQDNNIGQLNCGKVILQFAVNQNKISLNIYKKQLCFIISNIVKGSWINSFPRYLIKTGHPFKKMLSFIIIMASSLHAEIVNLILPGT